MSLTLATWATAGTITAGWSVLTSTILQRSEDGPQQQLAVEFGDTGAWPATAPICLSLRVTRLTRLATGWAAKRLSACKQDQSLTVRHLMRTTGRLPTG